MVLGASLCQKEKTKELNLNHGNESKLNTSSCPNAIKARSKQII